MNYATDSVPSDNLKKFCRLHFDSVTLYTLPRETRLSFTLRGIPITSGTSDNTVSMTPVVLAGATIQLFNYKG